VVERAVVQAFGIYTGTLSGDIGVDGSAIHLEFGACFGRRAGWAAVNVHNNVPFGIYGHCDSLSQTAPLAELQAVAEAKQVALPPFRIIYDWSLIGRGVQQGKQWCLSRPGGRYWAIIWKCIDDMQLGPEVFVKVSAHVSLGRAISQGSTYSLWFLNQSADRYAKLGAQQHALPADLLRTWRATRQLQRLILLWVARLTAMLGTTCARDVVPRSGEPRPPPVPRPLFRSTGHAAYAVSDGVFVCAFCKVKRGSFRAFEAFSCQGGLGKGFAHRLAALVQQYAESEPFQCIAVGHVELAACAIAAGYAPSTGHRLTHQGGVFFCARCGAYGTKHLARLLAKQCMPPSARGNANIRELRRARHPTSGAALDGQPVTLFHVVLPPLLEAADGSNPYARDFDD
jgi:hypothetical protein